MDKIAYVDTSVILRQFLGEKSSYKKLDKMDQLFVSDLMQVEIYRAIDRLRIQNSWQDSEVALRIRLFNELSEVLQVVPLQPIILKRASEPFPVVIKTLDALHIATALLVKMQLKQEILFLTHDKKQGIAASSCGLEVEG